MKDPAFLYLVVSLVTVGVFYIVEIIRIEIDHNKKSKELMKKYKQ